MSDYSPLSERISRLLQIFRDGYDFENESFKLNENQTSEFNSLWKSIVEDLMWSPGTLIHIANETERKAAQVLIDLIWKIQDTDEIFNKMTSGGYSGLIVIGDAHKIISFRIE